MLAKNKIPYTQLLKNNSERLYLSKIVELNTGALLNIIMNFFIERYAFFRAA